MRATPLPTPTATLTAPPAAPNDAPPLLPNHVPTAALHAITPALPSKTPTTSPVAGGTIDRALPLLRLQNTPIDDAATQDETGGAEEEAEEAEEAGEINPSESDGIARDRSKGRAIRR